jgi:membrane protein required for colicin V production
VNQVDALLLVLLLPFALRGYWRGLVRELFGLAGLLAGAAVAGAWSLPLAAVLVARDWVPVVVSRPVAFATLFITTVVAARLLGLVADRLVRALLLGGVNRVAGAAFGFAKGAAVAAFLLFLLQRLLPNRGVQELIAHSTLGRPLLRVAEVVLRSDWTARVPPHAPQHA